jgi:cellulose synthase/poly-beta-1,6-N-acetylglucosamine synthase-like glycosyltransferase/mono/diheme cytochrome c family protein
VTLVQGLLAALYVVALAGLAIYGGNAYVMVATHWRHRRRGAGDLALPEPLPLVTVQLPLYNERYVARRLLEAVSAFDYPRDRLEIQILDDSTDDTTEIVTAAAGELRARGLAVVHLHRRVRTGFKAGALAEGLARARGEFIAIFDADFVPPPGFLQATLPYFRPDVAVVQTRWGHLNRSFSVLTVAQALGIDGLFGVEQPARDRGGLFLNFNGTGGIWRRAAILDAGGWTPDTVTEDLDLSYRAQLRGWRIVYRPDIVCPAELPVLVTGFKSQQRRWAKGSIQTAIKLLPAVLSAPRSPWVRYQAFVHLTYYMIHPLLLVSVLLAVPMRSLSGLVADGAAPSAVGLLFSLVTLGPVTMLVYAQGVLEGRWWRGLWQLPIILVIGVGAALSTSLAVLDAFVGRSREFVRTPKFGIAGAAGGWRGKGYGDRALWGGAAELALGVYCAAATGLFWLDGYYAMVPFLALYTLGFLTVGGYTIVQSVSIRGARGSGCAGSGVPLRSAVSPGGAAGLVLVALLSATTASAADWESLVADGERWWHRSPVAGQPVACATCHHEPAAIRGWAASFPKVRPLPPPHARVMTLLQATAEAVARHYEPADPKPAAVAISAFLTARGAGLPLTPGVAPDQPVFPGRLRALAESVARGRRLYARRCAACHPGAIAPPAGGFLRATGRPAELFLEAHGRGGSRRLPWDSPAMADLLAYLAAQRAGEPVAAGGASGAAQEVAR